MIPNAPKSWKWMMVCALSLGACRPLPSSSPDPPLPPADWTSWRGPSQAGVTGAIALPVDWTEPTWSRNLPSGGTPVIFRGKLYAMTYPTVGDEVVERLVCLDARSGATQWDHDFRDFLSDIIYERYAIGSPAVDSETGQVHVMTSAGVAAALDSEGTLLWERSLMEEFGRLTFPNGRTGSPVVIEGLVIHRGITSHWGDQAPGRDRFFAFDAATGELVWTSTPGTRPGDSSFSTAWVDGSGERPVLYAGTGCGHVVAMDARTGTPLWRFRTGQGGVNSSVIVSGDRLVTIHGQENLDEARLGRMIALRLPDETPAGDAGQIFELPAEAEIWRNPLSMFTSSPALGTDRVYQCTLGGELAAVSLETGKILWSIRLGAGQLHASPLLAGNLLFVPMWEGELNVLDVSSDEPELLAQIALEGTCLGAPATWNGFLYVHTTERLYAYRGDPASARPVPSSPSIEPTPSVGSQPHLRLIPAEIALRPGAMASVVIEALDHNGRITSKTPLDPSKHSLVDAPDSLHPVAGGIQCQASAPTWSGALQVRVGEEVLATRLRILPGQTWSEDFEDLAESGHPPVFWVGARGKWTVEAVGGTHALTKSLDNILFQRNTSFIGHADATNYELSARVRSEGNRRSLSDVGLVNQRYLVALRGNGQTLEVSSNQDRLKVSVPFSWTYDRWYHLRTRVDTNEDGSGTVRGRAWPDGSSEPTEWSIEVEVPVVHPNGAPGVFGFSLQGRNRVFVDDLLIAPPRAGI